jgi:hypothetical protein
MGAFECFRRFVCKIYPTGKIRGANYMIWENPIQDKQEVALQFLNDAQDHLESWEILILRNTKSSRRYLASFITKATTSLVFSIECSLKSIISIANRDNAEYPDGAALRNWVRDFGHDIQKLYDKSQKPLSGQEENSFLDLRFKVSHRYSIENIIDFLGKENVTLQWDRYYAPALALLKIAQERYSPFENEFKK